jgi:hypothetical protein
MATAVNKRPTACTSQYSTEEETLPVNINGNIINQVKANSWNTYFLTVIETMNNGDASSIYWTVVFWKKVAAGEIA